MEKVVQLIQDLSQASMSHSWGCCPWSAVADLRPAMQEQLTLIAQQELRCRNLDEESCQAHALACYYMQTACMSLSRECLVIYRHTCHPDTPHI